MASSPYPSLRWWLLPFIRSRIWTVRGLENIPSSGGFILAPNHQSWIDSAMLPAALYRRLQKPLRFVAQTGRWTMFGSLAIDPNNRASVLEVAAKALNEGYPVIIYPEGNSNNNPELRVGKTGVARLALRTGLPVLPVGIKGTRGVNAGRALLWFLSLVYPCHIEVGQPLTFPKTELRDGETELLDRTTEKILREISALSGKPMPGEGPALGHRDVIWFIAWRLFRPLVQWRVRIRGGQHLPAEGPYIVAGNHNSYFDAPALSIAVFHVAGIQPMFPTKATVAQKFREYAGQGALHALGMLPLDNADKSKVLDAAITHLQRGGVVGIFPEGQRNKPSVNPNWKTEMLKGKTGAARLRIVTRVPIIPVSIRAPKGLGILEAVMKGILPWNFTRVTFGPPVQFSYVPTSLQSATKEQLELMTRELMTAVAQLRGLQYTH